MSNLTISIDDQLIKRARARAIEQGTSLSAKVREFLQSYVDESGNMQSKQREQAAARLLAAMDTAAPAALPARSARRSLRDDLYGQDFRSIGRAAAEPPKAKRRR